MKQRLVFHSNESTTIAAQLQRYLDRIGVLSFAASIGTGISRVWGLATPLPITYVTLLLGLILFLGARLAHIHVAIDSSRVDLRGVLDALRGDFREVLALVNVHKAIGTILSDTTASPLTRAYLNWLSSRSEALLTALERGEITAPEPDYFAFAEMVFEHAQKSIQSTSLVSPHWYQVPRCHEYIHNQILKLIDHGISYTRYFILSRTDPNERRVQSVQVMRRQVGQGFTVVGVLVDAYDGHLDAALIDERVAMVATVPKSGTPLLPEPEIVGCRCYCADIPDRSHDTNERIRVIKGYFASLDNLALVRFPPHTTDPHLWKQLETQYLEHPLE